MLAIIASEWPYYPTSHVLEEFYIKSNVSKYKRKEQIVTKQLDSGHHQGEQMIIKIYAYAFTQTGTAELLNNLN